MCQSIIMGLQFMTEGHFFVLFFVIQNVIFSLESKNSKVIHFFNLLQDLFLIYQIRNFFFSTTFPLFYTIYSYLTTKNGPVSLKSAF